MNIASQIRPALVLLILFTVLTGLVYPGVVTALAQLTMPWQANGSLIVGADGEVIGSELIGQPFDDPRYFWGRPSLTGPVPNNGAASSGSNRGPTNPALAEELAARVSRLREDPAAPRLLPADLVTSSASGLDPHISPAAARFQVTRVATARGLALDAVIALVEAHVEGRTFGLLGEPRVNVLRLNLALDDLH